VETIVKRILCCEFRRTGEEMGQVYQCWWSTRRRFEISHILRFIPICDLFIDSPSDDMSQSPSALSKRTRHTTCGKPYGSKSTL
jgi:hypothetical protein